MMEAQRVLRGNGVLLHFVDMTDHFAHTDSSISKINFCRFSEEEWLKMAGNKFSYCNRLRASDHLRLIGEAGFKVIEAKKASDNESVQRIRSGEFSLDESFVHYDIDDLCFTGLKVLARPD